MSIISMPCSAAWAMWASLSRLASRPPCTRGCSVFTRPSIISGNCVTSSMGVDRHAGVLERAGGAARRDDFRPELVDERAGEVSNAALVRNGHEHALDLRIAHMALHPFLLSATERPRASNLLRRMVPPEPRGQRGSARISRKRARRKGQRAASSSTTPSVSSTRA